MFLLRVQYRGIVTKIPLTADFWLLRCNINTFRVCFKQSQRSAALELRQCLFTVLHLDLAGGGMYELILFGCNGNRASGIIQK